MPPCHGAISEDSLTVVGDWDKEKLWESFSCFHWMGFLCEMVGSCFHKQAHCQNWAPEFE